MTSKNLWAIAVRVFSLFSFLLMILFSSGSVAKDWSKKTDDQNFSKDPVQFWKSYELYAIFGLHGSDGGIACASVNVCNTRRLRRSRRAGCGRTAEGGREKPAVLGGLATSKI